MPATPARPRPSTRIRTRRAVERRDHPRLTAACPVRLESFFGMYEAELVDVSLGGARVRCDEPLVEGVRLHLVLQTAVGPLPIPARVIWGEGGEWGLQFAHVLPGHGAASLGLAQD